MVGRKLLQGNVRLALEAVFASMPIVEMVNIGSMLLEETTMKNARIAKVLVNVRNAEQQGSAYRSVFDAMARGLSIVVML